MGVVRACVLALCAVAVTAAAGRNNTNRVEVVVAREVGIAAEWVAFHANLKSKDSMFRVYMADQATHLQEEIAADTVEVAEAKADVETKSLALRRLTLQIGDAVPGVGIDAADMAAAANTLVECAKANKYHAKIKNEGSQFAKLSKAAAAYAASLATRSKAASDKTALESILDRINHANEIHTSSTSEAITSFNSTLTSCINRQQAIAQTSEWIASDRVPLLEDIMLVRNERYVLQDTLDTLRIRQQALVEGLKIKSSRLASLHADAIEHDHVVELQYTSVSELTRLSRGLPSA